MEASTASESAVDPSRARSEFENVSAGQCGVVVIENGKSRGIAVRPEQRIWLSKEEQILTANAPRNDKDNPFVNGTLKLVAEAATIDNRRPIGDPSLGNSVDPEQAEANRVKAEADRAEAAAAVDQRQRDAEAQAARGPKPIAPAPAKSEGEGATPVAPPAAPDETAAAPEPGGQAAQGSRPAEEEVATPAAAPPAQAPAQPSQQGS